MRSRRSVSIALVVTLAGAAAAAAGIAQADTVTPPAGTPDLSMMVLQPSDLAAGATPSAQQYVTPVNRFSAEYVTDFAGVTGTDGTRYFSLQDAAIYATDATTPGAFLQVEDAYFKSRKGRKQLTRTIIKDSGKKAHLKARNIKFDSVGSISIGNSSALELLRVATKHYFFDEAIVLFDEGPVYSTLVIEGAVNEKLPANDILALASTNDAHIKAVLASTGTTGASGTTGPTG